MSQFNNTGKLGVDKTQLGSARQDFLAASCSEQQTIEYIAKFDKEHKYTLDPHTACGVAAVDELPLGTARPLASGCTDQLSCICSSTSEAL